MVDNLVNRLYTILKSFQKKISLLIEVDERDRTI
jgi:hypothetical protein